MSGVFDDKLKSEFHKNFNAEAKMHHGKITSEKKQIEQFIFETLFGDSKGGNSTTKDFNAPDPKTEQIFEQQNKIQKLESQIEILTKKITELDEENVSLNENIKVLKSENEELKIENAASLKIFNQNRQLKELFTEIKTILEKVLEANERRKIAFTEDVKMLAQVIAKKMYDLGVDHLKNVDQAIAEFHEIVDLSGDQMTVNLSEYAHEYMSKNGYLKRFSENQVVWKKNAELQGFDFTISSGDLSIEHSQKLNEEKILSVIEKHLVNSNFEGEKNE